MTRNTQLRAIVARACRTSVALPVAMALLASRSMTADEAAGGAQVTFTKDIAPILQRSCQGCHHAGGVWPMSSMTYEEVRPYARAIKYRTSLGSRSGMMPPWFDEKDIGIQKFKDSPSLSEAEIASIVK
jgi:hypothetical protein